MNAAEGPVISTVAEQYCSNTLSPIEPNEVPIIQDSLLTWYRSSRRMLPWRGDNTCIPRSAYGTWISEVMLQQTRVETVIAYWNRWMQAYPDVASLAKATPEEVNVLWAGLGYYRRAQMLLTGAVMVAKDFGGVLPRTVPELLTIPGIGPYTAGAIASIAYDLPEPLVDGNVIRVFSRLRAIKLEVGGGAMEKACWQIAANLVPQELPGDFNQALMELGATVCKPTSPSCDVCPLSAVCHARLLVDHAKSIDAARPEDVSAKGEGAKRSILQLLSKPSQSHRADGIDIEDVALAPRFVVQSYDVSQLPRDVTEFPRKIAKKKAKELAFSVCVLRTSATEAQEHVKTEAFPASAGKHKPATHHKYLFVRRPATGLLANQWEFPNILIADESLPEAEDGGGGDATAGDCAVAARGGVGHTETDLWSPFPAYFSQQLDMSWNPLSSSAVKTRLAVENGDVKREHVNGEVSAVGGVSLIEQGSVSGFEPIVHMFSHQRHTMHIVLKDVQLLSQPQLPGVVSTESTEEGAQLPSSSSTVPFVEHRWMSAEEIVAAGITTGCKKVLTEVSKKSTGPATKKSTTIRAPKATGTKLGDTKAAASASKKAEANTVDLTVEMEEITECERETKVPKHAPKNAFDMLKASANNAAPTKKRTKKS